jgi:hypothetical protein
MASEASASTRSSRQTAFAQSGLSVAAEFRTRVGVVEAYRQLIEATRGTVAARVGARARPEGRGVRTERQTLR